MTNNNSEPTITIGIDRKIALALRLWSRVDKQSVDCWIWKGAKTDKGYGLINIAGHCTTAHRLAYEITYGPVPEGLTVDHLCFNTSCIRPDHLEAVTLRENILRGNGFAARQARQTHCLRDHPLNEANTYQYGNHRLCRPCRALASQRLRARQGVTT